MRISFEILTLIIIVIAPIIVITLNNEFFYYVAIYILLLIVVQSLLMSLFSQGSIALKTDDLLKRIDSINVKLEVITNLQQAVIEAFNESNSKKQ